MVNDLTVADFIAEFCAMYSHGTLDCSMKEALSRQHASLSPADFLKILQAE
jgi:hypothetical protein